MIEYKIRKCECCTKTKVMWRSAMVCKECRIMVDRVKAAMQYPAAMAVAKAMKTGILPRLRGDSVKCVDCGKPARAYDHRDYDKHLDVSPVCRACNLKRGPAKQIAELGLVFRGEPKQFDEPGVAYIGPPMPKADTAFAILIQALVESGLSESDIVASLKVAGVTTTQQTINRLKNGATAKPTYDVGSAITALHARVCRKARAR